MSQKLILLLLAAGTVLFLSGIIYLTYQKSAKTFNYDAYLTRSPANIYVKNTLTPNMQYGFYQVDQKIPQQKNNTVYWKWIPDKITTAAVRLEFIPQTNNVNYIIFNAHTRFSVLKFIKENVQVPKLDVNLAALLAKRYWSSTPNANKWTCTQNTDKSVSCSAYAQNNSGKNIYLLSNYNKYLFATSCFISKNNPFYTVNTLCPSQ